MMCVLREKEEARGVVRGITFFIIIIISSNSSNICSSSGNSCSSSSNNSSSSNRSSREKRHFTAVKFSRLWLLLFSLINYICK